MSSTMRCKDCGTPVYYSKNTAWARCASASCGAILCEHNYARNPLWSKENDKFWDDLMIAKYSKEQRIQMFGHIEYIVKNKPHMLE